MKVKSEVTMFTNISDKTVVMLTMGSELYVKRFNKFTRKKELTADWKEANKQLLLLRQNGLTKYLRQKGITIVKFQQWVETYINVIYPLKFQVIMGTDMFEEKDDEID